MSSAIEAELAAGIQCSPSEDARTIKEGPLFLKMKRPTDLTIASMYRITQSSARSRRATRV